MQYNISFKRAVEGSKAYEYVGDDFVVIDMDAGSIIKDVTGAYPTVWKGEKCADAVSYLKYAVHTLTSDEKRWRDTIQGLNFSLEDVVGFLNRVRSNCEQYPEAIISVMVD